MRYNTKSSILLKNRKIAEKRSVFMKKGNKRKGRRRLKKVKYRLLIHRFFKNPLLKEKLLRRRFIFRNKITALPILKQKKITLLENKFNRFKELPRYKKAKIKKLLTIAVKRKRRLKRRKFVADTKSWRDRIKFIRSSKFGRKQNLVKINKKWYFGHRRYNGFPIPDYKVKDFYMKSKIAKGIFSRYLSANNLTKLSDHSKFDGLRFQIMSAAWGQFRLMILARKGRKRRKRIKVLPSLTFYRSVNNLFYALRNRGQKIFHISSIGTFGLKGKKRYEPIGMRKVAMDIAARFKLLRIYRVQVVCRSPARKGVRSIMWYFQKTGVKIDRIFDLIRTPHGNVRFPARRRMKRRRR
jgi:ribosomal protein S11